MVAMVFDTKVSIVPDFALLPFYLARLRSIVPRVAIPASSIAPGFIPPEMAIPTLLSRV
jgi:hypothetical protein